MEQSASMNRIQSLQKALTNCEDYHCMNEAVNKHEQDPIIAEGTYKLWRLPLHEWSSQQAWTGSDPGRMDSLPVDDWSGQQGSQSWLKALTFCGDCHCKNGAVNKHEQDPTLAEGTHMLLSSPCMNWVISGQYCCTSLSGYSHP